MFSRSTSENVLTHSILPRTRLISVRITLISLIFDPLNRFHPKFTAEALQLINDLALRGPD